MIDLIECLTELLELFACYYSALYKGSGGITKKYNLMSVKMAINLKNQKITYVRMWRNWNHYALLMGM